MSTGSFIGGYLIKNVGGSQTFRIFGFVALVFFAVHVALQKLLERFPCGNGKRGHENRVDGDVVNDDNNDDGSNFHEIPLTNDAIKVVETNDPKTLS